MTRRSIMHMHCKHRYDITKAVGDYLGVTSWTASIDDMPVMSLSILHDTRDDGQATQNLWMCGSRIQHTIQLRWIRTQGVLFIVDGHIVCSKAFSVLEQQLTDSLEKIKRNKGLGGVRRTYIIERDPEDGSYPPDRLDGMPMLKNDKHAVALDPNKSGAPECNVFVGKAGHIFINGHEIPNVSQYDLSMEPPHIVKLSIVLYPTHVEHETRP